MQLPVEKGDILPKAVGQAAPRAPWTAGAKRVGAFESLGGDGRVDVAVVAGGGVGEGHDHPTALCLPPRRRHHRAAAHITRHALTPASWWGP